MAIFNYNGQSNSSGVYVIFNNHNWRIYVGSCKNFKQRWAHGHNASLLRNKHSNKFLQSDFNKCKELLGRDDFLEFHVLENMPDSSREERLLEEEKWIKVHFDKGQQCYNLCNRAISKEGFEYKDPEAERIRKSLAAKKMWENPEHREKCLGHVPWNKGVRGYSVHSTEGKEQHKIRMENLWREAPETFENRRIWTEEEKQKHSSRMSGENNPMFGVVLIPWNKGKPHSEEHREKLRLAWIRRKAKSI